MTRTHPRWALVISAGLLAAMAGTRAQAQDEAQPAPAEEQLDRTPEDCVLMNRVSRNVGVNDRQVVFFMRGGTYYLNVLDGACQALTAGDTRLVFHYNTRSAKITRLCDTDSFTVERQTSRLGCALGQFTPITAEEAAALTGQPVAAPAASSSGDDQRSERRSRRNRD
jgi:hypothetical protein